MARWREETGPFGFAVLVAVVGTGMGLIAGQFIRLFGGGTDYFWRVLLVFGPGSGVVGFLLWKYVIQPGSDMAGRLYFGGTDAPPLPSFSLAESYAVRGLHAQAIVEYERACAESPFHPEPPLRLARMLRGLERWSEAVEWYRVARERAERLETGRGAFVPGIVGIASSGAITREMLELQVVHMDPLSAMPLLARVAETHRGTPHGAWAARRLAELKRDLFADDAG